MVAALLCSQLTLHRRAKRRRGAVVSPTYLRDQKQRHGHVATFAKGDCHATQKVSALPETLKRAARCGVIHCELLPEHVRHARGRGCFLIDYDPRLVHVVSASDADEFLEDGVGAAVMARQLLVLSTKAMAKDDEWQRRWPVNIDAWHALRQLAKRHKPEPLTAVKTRADDPVEPGALVSPFSPCEASLDSTLSQKACFFLKRAGPEVDRSEHRLADPMRLLYELALQETSDAPWVTPPKYVFKYFLMCAI